MNPSICIPKVDRPVTKAFIKNEFSKFGEIKKIDILHLAIYKRVFIHFRSWNTDDRSVRVREFLEDGLDFKIIYDEPWYWKCTVVY